MHASFVTALALLSITFGAAAQDVPKVIFDTDMTGDCDDAGALAVLHALADQGEVEILGCIASFGADPYVAGCIDAINTYYGRGDLPIGAEQSAFGRPDSPYAETIAKDTARHGHDVVTKADAPDHVTVYRELLAQQPGGSVTIVTVGRLKGLHDLLTSQPDDISPLDGTALVEQKAKRWFCMGGRYPNPDGFCEANFCSFGGSDYTKKVVESWPLPVLFSGFEIGEAILTGPALLEQSDDNPAARAYRLFFEALKQPTNKRPSWDQTAVLAAVRGPSPWWDVVTTGYNDVAEDGVNTWRESPDRDHAYLVQKAPPEETAAAISALMTQQPRKANEAPDVACPALDVAYAHLEMEALPAVEFARAFQRQTGIAVGFMEKDRADAAEEGPLFSFSAPSVSPREALDAWSKANPEYVWFPVSAQMINILPVAHFTDPASPLNTMIPRLEAQDVSARGALMLVSPFTRGTPRWAKFSVGGGIRKRGPVGMPYMPADRRVSLELEDLTVREALNQICSAAGPNMGWSWCGKVLNPIQSDVQEAGGPAVLAEARLKAKADSYEEALAAYERARTASMPEHMRLLAGLEMVQLALGEGRTEAQTHPDVAVDLLLELLRGPDKGLGLWRNWAIETLVKHADAAGRGEAAKQLLAELSEQSEAADDLMPETRKLLKDSVQRVE